MNLTQRLQQWLKGDCIARVDIRLNNTWEAYTSYDEISGSVTLTPCRAFELIEIQVALEGTVLVEIQRAGAGGAQSIVRSATSRSFLRVEQLIPGGKGPSARLSKDHTERFQFALDVPARLQLLGCCHPIADGRVRDEHNLLLPSLNWRKHDTGGILRDDMAPPQVRIQYSLTVSVTGSLPTGGFSRIPLAKKAINIVPTHFERAPVLTDGNPDYIVYVDRKVIHALNRTKLGRLRISAEQPKPLLLEARRLKATCISTPGVILDLEFEPWISSQEPPQLCNLRKNIECVTFFSTEPWRDFPSASPWLAMNVKRGISRHKLALSTTPLTKTPWKKATRRNDRACDPDLSTYTCSLFVPLILDTEKQLIPTFSSCFISRVYILHLSIHYRSFPVVFTSSVSLKIPLEVIAVT